MGAVKGKQGFEVLHGYSDHALYSIIHAMKAARDLYLITNNINAPLAFGG